MSLDTSNRWTARPAELRNAPSSVTTKERYRRSHRNGATATVRVMKSDGQWSAVGGRRSAVRFLIFNPVATKPRWHHGYTCTSTRMLTWNGISSFSWVKEKIEHRRSRMEVPICKPSKLYGLVAGVVGVDAMAGNGTSGNDLPPYLRHHDSFGRIVAAVRGHPLLCSPHAVILSRERAVNGKTQTTWIVGMGTQK